MASEPDLSEISSLLERLARSRDLSLFVPFFLGFTNSNSRRDSENPDQENDGRQNQRDRIILINPFTQGMVVVEGVSTLDTLFNELSSKTGQPPASKASIEAMPCVEIVENGVECVICLEELGVGGLAKEMPCKHKFHGDCIEKWLGIHGSCPVCRFAMPVDERELSKKSEEEGRERRMRSEREVWVSFSFSNSRRSQGSSENQTSSIDSAVNDSLFSSSSPEPDTADHELQS